MKKLLVSFLFLTTLFFCTSLSAQVDFFKGDIQQLKSQAVASNKMYIVVFSKQGCAPCQKMMNETFKDMSLASVIRQKALAYYVDSEAFENISYVMENGINIYPTIIFFTPQGRVIGKLFGYQPAVKLIALIQQSL